jgi:hypothetical protein
MAEPSGIEIKGEILVSLTVMGHRRGAFRANVSTNDEKPSICGVCGLQIFFCCQNENEPKLDGSLAREPRS